MQAVVMCLAVLLQSMRLADVAPGFACLHRGHLLAAPSALLGPLPARPSGCRLHTEQCQAVLVLTQQPGMHIYAAH